MTLIAEAAAEVTRPPAAGSTVGGRHRGRVLHAVVLVVAGFYFLVPIYAAAKFALTAPNGGVSWQGLPSIGSESGFSDAFLLSLKLAVTTTVITLLLMVPTAVWVHLRLPRLRRLLDGLTLLPIVIPPVVLIVGVLQVAPAALKATPY